MNKTRRLKIGNYSPQSIVEHYDRFSNDSKKYFSTVHKHEYDKNIQKAIKDVEERFDKLTDSNFKSQVAYFLIDFKGLDNII